MNAKKQHIIPQSLLKEFIKNQLYCYHFETKDYSLVTNTEDIEYEDEFYDDVNPIQMHEDGFHYIESRFSDIYNNKIQKKNSIQNLTNSDKFAIATYIYYLNERTKQAREDFKQTITGVVQNNMHQQKLTGNPDVFDQNGAFDEKKLRDYHVFNVFNITNITKILRIYNLKLKYRKILSNHIIIWFVISRKSMFISLLEIGVSWIWFSPRNH